MKTLTRTQIACITQRIALSQHPFNSYEADCMMPIILRAFNTIRKLEAKLSRKQGKGSNGK